MTDQRLLFVDSQRDETIVQVAGGVAHDLANLLVPIISYSELALDELDEEAQLFYDIEQILESARVAREITSRLLDFCRCRIPACQTLNLNTAVTGARGLLQRLLAEDIVLDLHLSAGLSDILADSARIDQVLINMTVNARDAMPSGGRYTIETADVVIDEAFICRHPGASAGPKVMISFTDTGHGISEPDLPHIFERFFTTKSDGGTGLGLSTVSDIAARYGAFIDVISSPGHGTCFKLFFPKTNVAGQAPETHVEELPTCGNGETILIISMDDPLRRLVSRILSRFGYTPVEAACPEDAVESALRLKESVALVISELSIVGMSGPSLAKELLAICPGARVLFMKGQERMASAISSPAELAFSYISKPFTVKTLAARVGKILADAENPAEHSDLR